jgi:hypothetical protein
MFGNLPYWYRGIIFSSNRMRSIEVWISAEIHGRDDV